MRKLIPCLLAALICLPGMAAPEAARAAGAAIARLVHKNSMASPKRKNVSHFIPQY